MVAAHRPRPLFITDDDDLLDAMLAVASDAGIELEVARDPIAIRESCTGGRLVLVGAGSVDMCVRVGLPGRGEVILVARQPRAGEPVSDEIWAAAAELGAQRVALLPQARPWLVDRLLTDPDGGAPVIAVIGGCGGAGASLLAVGLSVTAARAGLRTLLLDGDPLGGGLELALGFEPCHSVRWPMPSVPIAEDSPQWIGQILTDEVGLAAVSCDFDTLAGVSSAHMTSALRVGRAVRDLVVLDVPRRLDDAALVALHHADRVFMVVPAELRACAAATRVATIMAAHTSAIALIVRGPARATPPAPDIGRLLGLPVVGTLRTERSLPDGLEQGTPPAANERGPLAKLCSRLLADLDLRASHGS